MESPARIQYQGDGTFNIPGEQSLIIETSPGGLDVLDEEVPSGKRWIVTIRLSITEQDE